MRPGTGIALEMLAPVALDPALDGLEQVGPYRLRAEITAPDAARDRVHQKQRHRGEDQQAGEVIDLLRPDLDEEEIEAPVGQVDQHRLVRRIRAAVPAHERQAVIDAERDEQHDPFDAPERAVHPLRIDFPPRLIERSILRAFDVERLRKLDQLGELAGCRLSRTRRGLLYGLVELHRALIFPRRRGCGHRWRAP